MASWQPPIPAGALYSKAARALGPALPLLAYCYDLVDRDGWVKISLKDAAGDMDEAYPTVKRWWSVLESGPFFCEVHKLGRNGMKLKFKNVWIDWRILSARETPTDTFKTETGSEVIPNTPETPNRLTIGIINGSQSGSEMIPQENVYGTHDPDLAKGLAHSPTANGAHPTRKPKNDPTPKPIRDTLADVCRIGKISTREQQLQVNQSAAQIWKEQQKDGATPDTVAADIRYVAGYYSREDWRGKKGELPTPARIRESWGPAMAERTKKSSIPTELRATKPNLPEHAVNGAKLAAMAEARRKRV